VTRSFQRT